MRNPELPFFIISAFLRCVNQKTRFPPIDEKRALLIYLTETRSVVAAAAAPAAALVAVIGEYQNEDDEQNPIIVVTEAHISYLLSIPSYGVEQKVLRQSFTGAG